LTEPDSDETKRRLEYSAIVREEVAGWKACSAAKDDQARWDAERAFAFQEIVEARAFRLFAQYFQEGGFGEWVPKPTLQTPTTPTNNLNTTSDTTP
jgi:hypothetical protein